MSLYDAMKDAVSLAQKADNIELYRQLLDLSAQALELQAEVAHLKEENTALRQKLLKKDAIVRHKQPYITFAEDKLTLKYCAICWDSDEKTIQMDESMASGCIRLFCRKCGSKCYVSRV